MRIGDVIVIKARHNYLTFYARNRTTLRVMIIGYFATEFLVVETEDSYKLTVYRSHVLAEVEE